MDSIQPNFCIFVAILPSKPVLSNNFIFDIISKFQFVAENVRGVAIPAIRTNCPPGSIIVHLYHAFQAGTPLDKSHPSTCGILHEGSMRLRGACFFAHAVFWKIKVVAATETSFLDARWARWCVAFFTSTRLWIVADRTFFHTVMFVVVGVVLITRVVLQWRFSIALWGCHIDLGSTTTGRLLKNKRRLFIVR